MKQAPIVAVDPEVLGGTPVFAGTRIPVAVLFENLADGLSLDDVLDSFPALERRRAIEALLLGGELLAANGERQAIPPCTQVAAP